MVGSAEGQLPKKSKILMSRQSPITWEQLCIPETIVAHLLFEDLDIETQLHFLVQVITPSPPSLLVSLQTTRKSVRSMLRLPMFVLLMNHFLLFPLH